MDYSNSSQNPKLCDISFSMILMPPSYTTTEKKTIYF